MERIHELRGRNDSVVAVAAVEDDSPFREERQARRSGMKDALRLIFEAYREQVAEARLLVD